MLSVDLIEHLKTVCTRMGVGGSIEEFADFVLFFWPIDSKSDNWQFPTRDSSENSTK